MGKGFPEEGWLHTLRQRVRADPAEGEPLPILLPGEAVAQGQQLLRRSQERVQAPFVPPDPVRPGEERLVQPQGPGHGDGNAHFLPHFPQERILRRFMQVDAATGQVPARADILRHGQQTAFVQEQPPYPQAELAALCGEGQVVGRLGRLALHTGQQGQAVGQIRRALPQEGRNQIALRQRRHIQPGEHVGVPPLMTNEAVPLPGQARAGHVRQEVQAPLMEALAADLPGEEVLMHPQGPEDAHVNGQLLPELPQEGVLRRFMQADAAPGQIEIGRVLILHGKQTAFMQDDRAHPQVEAARSEAKGQVAHGQVSSTLAAETSTGNSLSVSYSDAPI